MRLERHIESDPAAENLAALGSSVTTAQGETQSQLRELQVKKGRRSNGGWYAPLGGGRALAIVPTFYCPECLPRMTVATAGGVVLMLR